MAQQVSEKKEEENDVSSAIALREDLIKVLDKGKVSDLSINPKVIVLDCKTDPKKAIEVLIQNKIRAAPVIDNDTSKFIGVLDLRDCVQFALDTYSEHSSKLNEMKQKALEFLTSSPQITTQSLKYLAKMRSFRTVKTNDSLLDVAGVLAKGSHIVGVIDEEKNKLVGLVTQGMLFQQIAKKWGETVFANKSGEKALLQQLFDMNYITHPVKSIRNSVKAYEAFSLMTKLNLSGLAVVNADGVLIHNTSATDIKLWLMASSALEESIEQFLISIRKLSLTERYPITVCQLGDSFKRGVQKIEATKYHRLWIVDEKTKPIGVLALTDIFKFVCKTKDKKEIAKKDDDDSKNKE